MPVPVCRFILSGIKEAELRGEDAYTCFEPSLTLEIYGSNAFERFGREHVPVVIMHSREGWLRETTNLLRHIDQGLEDDEGEAHRYPLLGTLCDICVAHPGDGVLRLSVDWERKGRYDVARIRVRDWVEAVAVVSRELSDLFRRYHPTLFSDPLFARQEFLLGEIESWLRTQKSG